MYVFCLLCVWHTQLENLCPKTRIIKPQSKWIFYNMRSMRDIVWRSSFYILTHDDDVNVWCWLFWILYIKHSPTKCMVYDHIASKCFMLNAGLLIQYTKLTHWSNTIDYNTRLALCDSIASLRFELLLWVFTGEFYYFYIATHQFTIAW